MEEQFIPYEQALKLEELGFDEECLAYQNNTLIIYDNEEFSKNSQFVGNTVAIPLWQQVIDWLREKHKINIYPEPTYSLTEYSFKVITVHGKSKKQEYWDGMGKTYNTYQEAREQAILKAIELCKSKQ